MKKILTLFISLFMVTICIPTTVFADDTSDKMHKETVTISHSEYESFDAKKEIEINGDRYTLIGSKIISDDKKTFEVVTDNLPDKNYTAPQSITNPKNPYQNGKLVKTVFSENKESNRHQTVTKNVNYTAVPINYSIPDTFKTEYTDKKSNDTVTANLKLVTTEKSNPYWIKADNLEGTVTGYDALYYSLNNSDVQIPKNVKQPSYTGYESAILKSLGLNERDYKIVGSSWSGNAYYNSEGILCRNCIYEAQTKVCDVNAIYSENVQLSDIITYTATSIYEDEESSKYTIETEYEKVKEKTNTKVIVIGTVIGSLVLAALISIILVYLSKKKKIEGKANGKKR